MQKSLNQSLSRCRRYLDTWRKRYKPHSYPKISSSKSCNVSTVEPHGRKCYHIICSQSSSSNHCQRVRFSNLAIIAILLANFLLGLIPRISVVNAAGCDDVEFIFARGSGEAVATEDNPTGGPSYQQWKSWNEEAMYDSSLKTSFYDLGGKRYGGHQYPAVPVTESFGGIINLIGAALSAGEGFAFGESVDEGVAELRAHIEAVSLGCPNTKFVLGGFSQGAMVISKSLGQLDPDKIIYAATFGDPKIYLPEGDSHKGLLSKIPDACKGLNFSNYRVYVPDCYAYEGALGSYRPYQPDGYWNKLGTWCNGDDIMCSSGWSISDHIDYVNNNFYQHAASIIRAHIEATFRGSSTTTPPNPTPMPPSSSHDVAFLFDATGSMKELIEIYKTQAKELVSKVINAGGRVALFAYREFLDDDWPRLRCDFDCSEEEISKSIDKLVVRGGGDEDEEGLLSAAKMALDRLNWAEGATKSIVVLTDAGYHDPDLDGSTLESIVQRALEIDPVNIYVVSSNNEDKYADLVRLTNGEYFDVNTEAELSVQRIFERPIAMLNQLEFYGVVGETIEFDASSSHSQYGENLAFEWDLTGNNDFVSFGNLSKVNKTFDSAFEDFIQVRVSDSHGISTMSAKVKIVSAPEDPARITNLQVENSDDTSSLIDLHPTINSQAISFSTDAAKVLVVLEDAPMGFVIPENDAGFFSVEDVTRPTQLTLIPYSSSGRRGEKVSVTLQPKSQSGLDDPDNQKPVTPPSPNPPEDKNPPLSTPDDTVTGVGSDTDILPPPLYIIPSERPKEDLIPTAPSAGTCW